MTVRKWEKRIGKNYIDRLPEVVITVGRDHFTRKDLVIEADSANFFAARNLDKALQHFEPKSVKEVAKRVDLFMLIDRGNIGDTAIMVWCRILKASGGNPDEWLDQDFTGKKRKRQKK